MTLVTGGILRAGRAIAERLALVGHHLVLNYAGNAAAADAARVSG